MGFGYAPMDVVVYQSLNYLNLEQFTYGLAGILIISLFCLACGFLKERLVRK